MDDPVICKKDFLEIDFPVSVDLVLSKKGGHVGFLGPFGYWLDDVVMDWVK